MLLRFQRGFQSQGVDGLAGFRADHQTFIVELGAVFATVIAIVSPSVFAWLIVFWLWLTVLLE